MPHVKLPRDIRRGYYYSERLLRPVRLSMEIFLFFPLLIKGILYALGIVGFSEFFAHNHIILLLKHNPINYRIM